MVKKTEAFPGKGEKPEGERKDVRFTWCKTGPGSPPLQGSGHVRRGRVGLVGFDSRAGCGQHLWVNLWP